MACGLLSRSSADITTRNTCPEKTEDGMSPIPIREMVPGGPRKVAALAPRVRSGLGWLFQRRSQTTSVKAAEAPIASAQRPPAQTAAAGPTRTERDLLGEYPGFVESWAIVKLAAARANTDVGAMKPDTLAAIEKATDAVLQGQYHDQFLVDWYQGGAGTSTNMNANEVLANVALELTGHQKGDYKVIEPHDHLNLSQSTNDSYPTAIKVALRLRNDRLMTELKSLVASFRAKGDAFIDIVKMGRTELQDAVPMTVGQRKSPSCSTQ
jgi:hypothetical protein